MKYHRFFLLFVLVVVSSKHHATNFRLDASLARHWSNDQQFAICFSYVAIFLKRDLCKFKNQLL